MKKLDFFKRIGLAAGCWIMTGFLGNLWGAGNVSSAAKQPNILIIFADDLGYGDLSCYNPESKVTTPNLDKLASQGVRFTDAHSPCTVCSPSRYALLTGRLAFRTGTGSRVFTGAGGPSLIEKGRLTLPAMLREQGYSTACVGKWHVGLTFHDKNGQPINKNGLEAAKSIDYNRPISGGPYDKGFDYFCGTACCPTTDWLYCYIENDRVPVPPQRQINANDLPGKAKPHPNWDNWLVNEENPYGRLRQGMIAPNFEIDEVDMVFLEKSKQYLKKHVKQKPAQPFFLYHCPQGVHLPSYPAERFRGKTNAGPHGDFIYELDYVVGELLKTLDELGVADNTLVMFSSDNGPEDLAVHHMRENHHHDGARPWRGIKRDDWEGGHRVPFIARWPGHIKPGSVSDQILNLTDIMATCAEIVGTELPGNAGEDSYNMLGALLGNADEPIRKHMVQQALGNNLSIRQGPWKYLDHKGSGGNNYENNPYLKSLLPPDNAPNAPAQLYHLDKDPGETNNLYFDYPEKVNTLDAQLEKYKESGRSTPKRD